MSSGGGLFSGEGAEFHPSFLGILIACGALSVFTLLYFNRVFASVVSWGIRTYTFHRYGVYIDIQALQISLLAGRIFFTGFRYHGNNETILVQNGHITWAYWLRRVRQVDIGTARDTAAADASARLPCRVKVSLMGLEWFIYNRSPAYDSVLAGLTKSDAPEEKPPSVDEVIIEPVSRDAPAKSRLRRRSGRRGDKSTTPSSLNPPATAESASVSGDGLSRSRTPKEPILSPSSSSTDGPGAQRSRSHAQDEDPDLPLFLQLLPISLTCERAAVVMGNENTKAILIIKTSELLGEADASEASTLDHYRQYYRFQLKKPVVEMKENMDFKEDQADRAVREKQMAQGSVPHFKQSFFRGQRRRLREALRGMVPFWNRSVESLSPSDRRIGTAASQVPGSSQWQGLSRYLADDDEDQKARWASCEYAAVPTLIDSPDASLTVFWDVVGKVAPPPSHPSQEKLAGQSPNINGAPPPAWGITLSLNGGSINYGPWADRHRADLQRVFVPSLCRDAVPARPLRPGEDRVPTQFTFYLELTADTVIRVPTREASKNWRWKGKEPAPKKPGGDTRKARRSKKTDPSAAQHERSHGWLDLRVPKDTTVSYSMDMVAGSSGYTNTLDVDIPSTEISSSINHGLLLKSGRQRIACDLSAPLGWNALRQWHFRFDSEDLDLYLLREHVFLLTDLVDDWTSGPPVDYLVFTPFKYHFDLRMRNIRLYMNINDANIINNPTDLDDNTYLIISSPLLSVGTRIDADTYRASESGVPFDIRAETATFDLHLPPWNTQAQFLTSKEVGRLENLAIEGGYYYHATTSPGLTDTLVLKMSAQSPIVQAHGFTVRYFMKVKDNYFGDDIHFKTLEEHQDMLRLKEENPGAEPTNKPPPKKTNDLDIMLSIRVDDPKILLPASLYSSQRHIQIDTASMCLDLRFTNYYMDLDLVIAPLHLSLGNAVSGAETPMSTAASSTQLFVDGLHVYGHRLFGLPPTEPTYMCNWDLSLGALTGECTTEFLTSLVHAGKAFAFTFDDDENALIPFSSIIVYDATFLRVFVHSVRLWLHVDDAAFLFSTDTIDINYNDWARSHYSRRANINIPDIKLSCINAETSTRHKTWSQHAVEADALVETSVRVAIIGRKAHFSRERRLQQDLIREHDQRTNRTPFLILPDLEGVDDFAASTVDPPAQSVPRVPLPIQPQDAGDDGTSLRSKTSSKRSRSLRHKSSFLSLNSSATGSVVKPLSSRRSSGKGKIPEPLPGYQSRHGERLAASSTQPRETSPSTRHSAFYSMPGDSAEHQDSAHHNTVVFSSPYFAPYFPLENVRPSHGEAMVPNMKMDDESWADFESVTFDLDDVDPRLLDEDVAHSSILLELPKGLTAVCNPTALRCVASLLSSMQDTDPDAILDSLQMTAMGAVFDAQKDQTLKGRVSDLLVRLPHLSARLINSPEGHPLQEPSDEQDQYDVVLTRLSFTTRTQTSWQDAYKPQSKESRNSFHLRLDSAKVSAAERVRGMDNSQAAAVVRMDSILASMGDKDVTYFDAEIGGIHASTFSGKVDYLASLVHRTGVLASGMGNLFAEVTSQEQRTVQNLIHRLTTAGDKVPDPSFLIRPSAVLRSARQHLRTFDSWKLAMRLRQIWTVLAPKMGEQIKIDCLGALPGPVAELRRDAIKAFAKWRSWDLGDLEDSWLLDVVFGPSVTKAPNGASQEKPTLAAVRVKQVELALNPGPKQNEITLVNIVTKLQHNPAPSLAEKLAGAGETAGQSTVLSISCEDAAVSLNWELCELADKVLALANNAREPAPVVQSPVQSKPANIAPARAEQRPSEHTIHCVLSMGNGSLILDAVNLHSASFSKGVQASLLVRKRCNNAVGTNLTVNCASVTSSLRSHHQRLAKLVWERPRVFVSHELQPGRATQAHTIKAAASSQYLSLIVKQDPVTLAEVADLVVRDEFAQVYGLLKNRLPSTPQTAPSSSKNMAEQLSAFRINVALFMDQYTISVPLLPSLIYTVHGTVSRAAVAATSGREIIFDFDIKENSHDIQVRVNNTSRSISLLQIPPTNGRVRSLEEAGERFVSVFASVELVQLDASAVYSLLSALNRPEISSVVKDLKHQVKSIQKHVSEITGGVAETKSVVASEVEATALAYAVHLSIAGLEVFGNSPLQLEKEPLAHISFALGSIRVAMSNRTEQSGPLLTYPEISIALRRITFEIQRGNATVMRSCGSVAFGASISASSRVGEDGKEKRFFHVTSDAFAVDLSPETISTVVDVLGYMGDKIKDLDTTRELGYLRKLRHQSRPRFAVAHDAETEEETDIIDAVLSSVTYSFEVRNIQVAWRVIKDGDEAASGKEDLVLSLQRIELGTRTRNSARLTIEHLQLEMVSPSYDRTARSPNSALLPEVIFNVAYVSTADARRLAFQAVGKSLDVRLTSGFIIPAAHLNDSISLSYKNIQLASQNWNPVPSRGSPTRVAAEEQMPRKNILGGKRLESLLIDADFAGAVVHLTGRRAPADLISVTKSSNRPSSAGRQGGGHLGADETASSTTLKSPGLAWKLEYRDNDRDDPSLHVEIKIDASSNILYPSVVPLVVDISNSIQKVVRSHDEASSARATKPAGQRRGSSIPAKVKLPEEDSILTADPTAVLGRMRLNIGLRICKQEFSLSCQPIARVAATASFDDVYFTANTVRSVEQGNFFAISGAFTNLQASVQHVYSRESTGSFRVQTIVFSLLNSKHLSGTSGVSAILKVSPMEVSINARQLQDFLLFREIWLPKKAPPAAVDPNAPRTTARLVTETSQGHLVQRYQQVAATAAFPWTASISISALKIVLDLGQSLGRSTFSITDFWVSSKKTSDWQQNLCLGFGMVGVESTGRMSGFVVLRDFKLRTSIEWPEREQALSETPLIQASVGFSQLRLKAAFDYQAFLVADISSLDFLMYNIRRSREGGGDRLVATLQGEAVQVFGTTTSAAQGLALYQAFQRLMQERRANFESSLKEIERYMQRKSVSSPTGVAQRLSDPKPPATGAAGGDSIKRDLDAIKSPISLDTHVVVALQALNLGVFPSTFSDHQVFKMEALNAQARFAALVEQDSRIHSTLSLTLGQLRIGLAAVRPSTSTPASPTTSPTIALPISETKAAATATAGGRGPSNMPSESTQASSAAAAATTTTTAAAAAAAAAATRTLAGELSVEEIVRSATGSRGGTILKVPRVEASMQTWQRPESRRIDYIFRSAFEGKVEVGWNYSRISYIRGMWANHSRTLTQAWGRELPGVTAIKVTGALPEAAATGATGAGEQKEEEKGKEKDKDKTKAASKITAEVTVPVSRYEYVALETPVIETPQLRDMGEATPPLEWIGVNRERLPNLTHQIVIVSLLELAGEVEDAYERILGSS
ncbi:hypothetical protein VTJ83DRAFT_4983 [Remersonia thermophila]|uniref:Fermentation associated protein n=1 Tax=Remersonia thermophila TaxID=72144 RepID=A0ABR4DBJ8_9PEZI